MKRSAVVFIAAVLFLLSAVASADETKRYLVATRHPFRSTTLAEIRQSTPGDVQPRRVAGFETFTGFAADLTESEVAELRASRAVRWVEPVLERHAFGFEHLEQQLVPYGIEVVRARAAWTGQRTGQVNVAIIDTGMDFDHAELKDVFAGGFNVITFGADPRDDNGHGTHVAGTIAAANNTVGVVGVAPDVKVFAVKALNSSGNGSTEGIIEALDWVVEQKRTRGGNWVVNLSLGSAQSSPAERESFTKAVDAGLIVVAASGNASTSFQVAPVSFPAAYPGVVAVGAVDSALRIASFSNQGPELDLSAPGVNVFSTVPRGSTYAAYVADGLKLLDAKPLTGSKEGTVRGQYVYCGVGRSEDFPASVNGRIALIKRGGDITFADKTRRAKEAGAIAVAIFNNADTARDWTLKPPSDPAAQTYDWPVTLSLSQEDGEALAAKEPHTITLALQRDDYGYKSGTSMASPHVAAAAALLWTLAPDATASSIINALMTTAVDRGDPGLDPTYGAGVINVYAAARLLAPGAFVGQPDLTRPTTGRPAGVRGRR